MTCPGCGGVVGRDCWNPQECEWISRDMAAQKFLPEAPGDGKEHIMEQRQHPTHPPRELALQLAVGHRFDDDTAESIVVRAEKYAAFLTKQ